MKENITWLLLWCKRIAHKPLIFFTILLMPVSVFFLQHSSTKQDAVLRVALFSDDPDNTEFIEHIISLSDSSIYFYQCSSRKNLIDDVRSRTAGCGYLIPGNLEKHITTYIKTRKPFLTVVCEKDDVTTKIVDEIILSKNFRTIAYYILENFLEQHHCSAEDKKQIAAIFDSHCSNELLFHFQTLSGETNRVMQDRHSNLLMLPIRGMLAAILLLTCMAGELLYFQDRLSGRTCLMTGKQKRLAALYSALIPGTAASVCALISINAAGTAENIFHEIPALACFLFACTSLSMLIGRALGKLTFYLSSMPLIFLLSLLLPPIFVDLGKLLPAAGKLSMLLPATWYLKGIQNPQNLMILLAYGAICLAAAEMISMIQRRRQ